MSWSSAAGSAGSSRRWTAPRSACGSPCWRHRTVSADSSGRPASPGLVVDVGAESFATRGGHVRALVDEVGLGGDVVTPEPGGAWLAGMPGAAPLPKGGLLGIPESPFADDVRRIIGWSGAWRAYLDRLRPPLTIGTERSLGRLVRSRMGDLVARPARRARDVGRVLREPDDIDIEIAAPGLNAALTRAGLALRSRRPARAAAAPRRPAARSRASTAGCRDSSTRSPPGWRSSASRSGSRRPVDAIAPAPAADATPGAARLDGRHGGRRAARRSGRRRDVRVVRAAAARGAHRSRRRRSPRPARAHRHARRWMLPSSTPRRAAPECSPCPAATRPRRSPTRRRSGRGCARRRRGTTRTATSSGCRSARQSEPPATDGLDLAGATALARRRGVGAARRSDRPGSGRRQRHRALRADASRGGDRAAGCRSRRPRRRSPPRAASSPWARG